MAATETSEAPTAPRTSGAHKVAGCITDRSPREMTDFNERRRGSLDASLSLRACEEPYLLLAVELMVHITRRVFVPSRSVRLARVLASRLTFTLTLTALARDRVRRG